MTTPSRADSTKTIYEILFRRKPDITRIPPYDAFTCIYKERRDLKDQSFGLTSIQGAFIGIAYHRKTLGYCITDGMKVSCTRHHIAFDPYLYPFKLNATTPPTWQTFHNLTTGKAQAAIQDFPTPQTQMDLPHTAELLDNSDESDFDPEVPAPANTSVEIDDMQPDLIDSDNDEEHMVPAVPEPPMPTGRSTRVRQAPVSFKEPAKQTKYQRYNSDADFRTTRDALVHTKVRKYFPGYGTFQGIITSYYPITDNFHILYDDVDEEVATYDNLQKYIEGTPEYDQEHQAALALSVYLDAAITSAATMTSYDKKPNHYKEAMRAPDSAQWRAACDVEMKKLRERNCWTVVRRADIPKGTRVTGGRWTFKYKRDETGALSKVSHRSR
jgi:hypothetical protein